MNADRDMPLVSIGVPVYNEERHVGAALDALRAQQYANLEIIVCDNASTDATLEVCERHAAQDPRIRIERAERNLGVVANFTRALDAAQGEYFMWAGGHDLTSANLVSACVALLESHPGASLAFASTRWIGAQDEGLARESGSTDTRGLTPVARLMTIFWGNMHPVMGVMRTSVLRQCARLRNIVGGDLVLLADLALRGDFLHAADATWSRRELRCETRHDEKLARYADATTRIGGSRWSRAFPLLQLPFALVGVVMRARLPGIQTLLTIIALLACFPLRYSIGRRARVE